MKNTESMAQFADRFLLRTAIGVLLVAIAYAAGAAMYLVGDEIADYLDKLQLLLAVAAVVIILPGFIKYARLRAAGQCRAGEPEGFVAEVFNKACVKAFSLTFVFLIILEPLSKKYLTELPTNFFINLTLCLSLGVFSLTFFFLNREDDDDLEDEFGPESGT
jgi:hypothetical protein